MIAIALAAAGGAAHAQPAPAPDPGAPATEPTGPGTPGPAPTAPPGEPGPTAAPAPAVPPASDAAPASDEAPAGDDEVGDQAISVELGVAAGGRITPGGLRITGQFIYQLSDEDWFDGSASFTFGSGTAACFRDRQDAVICSHGPADGVGVELTASVRRMFAPQGVFHPFARAGVGLGLVRFSADDVSGFTIPAHAGGGVRVAVAPAIGLIVEGDLALGFGSFSRGIGSQPQLGLAIAAGAEFRLR